MSKTTVITAFIVAFACLHAKSGSAQELKVAGYSSATNVIEGTNTSTSAVDRVGVHGVSLPAPFWGYGGMFEGGFVGVKGVANLSGSGTRYGGYFDARNGTTNYGVFAYAPTAVAGYAGYFAGNVYVSGSLTQASDLKLKTNIQDMSATLPLVLKLRPKNFRYNRSLIPALSLPDGDQVGFVAQDVAQVFPDLVKPIAMPADDKNKSGDSVLSVDYIKMVPLLVKAIQEQQTQIEALKAQVASLSKH